MAKPREFWVENCTKSSKQLSEENGGDAANWRRSIRRAKQCYPDLPWRMDKQAVAASTLAETAAQTELRSDGSCTSSILVRMHASQTKDPTYLLTIHGFDPEKWDVVSAISNVWQQHSTADGTLDLYQSKLTAKPKAHGFDVAAVVEACRKVEPVRVKRPRTGARMLELNNSDMHFGNSTFDWYAPNLAESLALIESSRWAQVLLPIGSDLFHCDNFKNTTSNGTPQSSVAWPEAWADALRYYSTLIECALANSRAVYAYYIVGNHDESMSWAFCQMLSAKYPQVVFDLDISERKVHRFGECAVGMTHGDGRNRKDLDRIFMAEFPEFACASGDREVHAGHYHHEMTKDEYGVVVRSISTAARTDKWHREEGYVGACKRFMAFRWCENRLQGSDYL